MPIRQLPESWNDLQPAVLSDETAQKCAQFKCRLLESDVVGTGIPACKIKGHLAGRTSASMRDTDMSGVSDILQQMSVENFGSQPPTTCPAGFGRFRRKSS